MRAPAGSFFLMAAPCQPGEVQWAGPAAPAQRTSGLPSGAGAGRGGAARARRAAPPAAGWAGWASAAGAGPARWPCSWARLEAASRSRAAIAAATRLGLAVRPIAWGACLLCAEAGEAGQGLQGQGAQQAQGQGAFAHQARSTLCQKHEAGDASNKSSVQDHSRRAKGLIWVPARRRAHRSATKSQSRSRSLAHSLPPASPFA